MSATRTIVITLPKPLPPGAQVKGIITPESVNGYMTNKSSSPMVSARNIIQVVKEERQEIISMKFNRDDEGKSARKRQKLDHLSFDEKLMRRKLKNRVAAQSARDRKKVRMDELEEQVSKLSDKVSTLSAVVKTLSKHNAQLEDEKELLQNRLSQCTCNCVKPKGGNFVSDNKACEEKKTPVCSVTVKSAELPQPRAVTLQAAIRALFLTLLYSQTKSPLEDAKALLTAVAKKNVALAKPLLQELSACRSNEELHKWMAHHQPPWMVEVSP